MRYAIFLALLLMAPMLSGCIGGDEAVAVEEQARLIVSESNLDSIFLEEVAGTGVTVCDATIKITYGLEAKMAISAAAAAFNMVAIGGGPAGFIGAVAMYSGAQSAEYMVEDYCTDGEMDKTGDIVTNIVSLTLETLNTDAGRSNDSDVPEDGEWFTNDTYLEGQISHDSLQLNTAHRKGYHVNVNENGELELVAVFSLEFENGNYEQTFLSQSGVEITTEQSLDFRLWPDHLEFVNSKYVPLKAGFVKWAYDLEGDLILSFTFDKEQVTTVCSARIRGYQSDTNSDLFYMQIMLDIVSANRFKTPLILIMWFELDIGNQTAESDDALWSQDYFADSNTFDTWDGWSMLPVEQVSPAIQNQDGYCRPTPWLD